MVFLKLLINKTVLKPNANFARSETVINANLNMYKNDHLRMYTFDY